MWSANSCSSACSLPTSPDSDFPPPGSPAVLEVAVLGLSDAVYGEQVAAVVGLRPGQPAPSSDELAAWLRERLAHYKVPRKVLFVPHIPRNTMHKVNKKELRRLFE
jgi:acyl-CoA synthetase (AMP-forming)/AMP-acid ligase II